MTHVSRTPVLVSLNQLGFQFANGQTLFNDLNLTFDHTPTAIVGRNGIGKSVLARLIAGQLHPTSGRIHCPVDVAYVAQSPSLAPEESVAETIGCAAVLHALERVNRGSASVEDFDIIDDQWDLPERLRRMLDDAGLPGVAVTDLTEHLSGGQQARVALIGALLSQARVLILDEPSNHLDAPGHRWLLNALERWRGGLIVVSHDRSLLDRMQRVIELSASGASDFTGNYSAFRQQQQRLQAAAQARLDQARSERQRERQRMCREHDTIQRHAATSRRNADTANIASFERVAIKSAARDIMGHVRHGHQARKAELDAQVRDAYAEVVPETGVLINLPGSTVPATRQVCTLVEAVLPWLPSDAPTSRLSLNLCGPLRIAVSGPNGCGKSTLLKLLAQTLAPAAGECTTHVPLAFLYQQLALLDDQRSIIEQLLAQGSALSEGTLRSHLAHLQLDARRATQPCAALSGGERLKAALALALWGKTAAQLLLLDEPTNHLDLASVEAFEQALQTFPGAIVAVSHDQAFLQALNPSHYLRWQPSGWQLQPTN
ncbi:ATP-binding cassette domain-containing protein [Pseudomonas sp. efr-133-TYG-5]|uniref:ABC-F family ATP-binding cassette domain-containing protein n=1 Tax=Pseudomonas sp. efr-133-TYG-5 TaxID=3040310 RepID=UPI002556AFFD|nr:ATP-binding cassette domain-containing protein [Pseudomonas sp. efr-133-TYG-5]